MVVCTREGYDLLLNRGVLYIRMLTKTEIFRRHHDCFVCSLVQPNKIWEYRVLQFAVQAVRHLSHTRSYVGTALIIIIIIIIVVVVVVVVVVVSVSLDVLKQMSPATLGSRQPISATHFPCVFHYVLRQSILISVGHVLVDLQGLSIISLIVIRFHLFPQHCPSTSVYWILLG